MGADNEESHAGTPIAWVGSVFAGQLASKLAMVHQKLRSICFANDQRWLDASQFSFSIFQGAGPLAERERAVCFHNAVQARL